MQRWINIAREFIPEERWLDFLDALELDLADEGLEADGEHENGREPDDAG
jgi:hypothetical protein